MLPLALGNRSVVPRSERALGQVTIFVPHGASVEIEARLLAFARALDSDST